MADRRKYKSFGFQYPCVGIVEYPWISLYDAKNDIDEVAEECSENLRHGIVAVWKLIKYKRGPAPSKDWWTKPPKPIDPIFKINYDIIP